MDRFFHISWQGSGASIIVQLSIIFEWRVWLAEAAAILLVKKIRAEACCFSWIVADCSFSNFGTSSLIFSLQKSIVSTFRPIRPRKPVRFVGFVPSGFLAVFDAANTVSARASFFLYPSNSSQILFAWWKTVVQNKHYELHSDCKITKFQISHSDFK